MIRRSLNIVVGVLAILLLTGTVKAEEKNYHLKVETIEPSKYSEKFKIKPSDAPRGVYITATGGWSATYPNVAAMLKDKFRAHGFSVTDKVEEADIGLEFGGTALPFDDIEDHVSHVNKEFVASHLGAAVLTGGISIVGTGLAMIGKQKGLSFLAAKKYTGPMKLTGRGRIESESGSYNTGLIGSNFVVDEVNASVYTDIFVLYLDAWMKEFTVSETHVPTPDAVPATSQVPLQPNADLNQ